jgi:hypothetical protein
MNSDDGAQMRSDGPCADDIDSGLVFPSQQQGLRHHVITRLAVERSGRLYSPFDWDFEIPSLEIYRAR